MLRSAMNPETTLTTNPDVLEANLKSALDTLAKVVSCYGENAFDLPRMDALEMERLCKVWAEHIEHGTPRTPTLVEEPETTTLFHNFTKTLQSWRRSKLDESAAFAPRDWRELRVFFQQQREEEHKYVLATLASMQAITWSVLHTLNRSVASEQDSDGCIQKQFDKIMNAVQAPSIVAMRDEISSAIEEAGRIFEKKQREQSERMVMLHGQVQELDTKLQQARQEGERDSLTRLYNRKALDNQLSHALDMHVIFKQSACLLILDIDHFKRINDTYGHLKGDEVLREFADTLVRTAPGKSDYVARYGGEEFAILLANSGLNEGKRMGERVLNAAREMTIFDKETRIPVTVSVGVAEISGHKEVEEWLDKADKALYRAKQTGRDRVIAASSGV